MSKLVLFLFMLLLLSVSARQVFVSCPMSVYSVNETAVSVFVYDADSSANCIESVAFNASVANVSVSYVVGSCRSSGQRGYTVNVTTAGNYTVNVTASQGSDVCYFVKTGNVSWHIPETSGIAVLLAFLAAFALSSRSRAKG